MERPPPFPHEGVVSVPRLPAPWVLGCGQGLGHGGAPGRWESLDGAGQFAPEGAAIRGKPDHDPALPEGDAGRHLEDVFPEPLARP